VTQKFTREQPRVAPQNATSILVEIEAEYVPLLFSALEKYHNKYFWVSEEDYAIGLQGVIRLERALLTDMSEKIVDAIDRVYRLLDTALNGTQYTWAANPVDPQRPIIGPEIPIVPPAVGDEPLGARAQLHRLYQLVENGATGAEFDTSSAMLGTVGLDFDGSWRARLNALQGVTGGFFGIGAVPVTLADLLKAGRINTDIDQGLINDGIEEVLGALSSGSNIGSVISNLLGTAADAATDGGVIAATLAAAVANAATSASLAAQLDRIITALDGGGLVAPSDNVLATLKDVETLLS
jgi:hypothetical protein